ncbi:MAG: hypothetical protein ACFCVG_12175 [Kineosporiaceae bacterium]
MRRRRGRRPHRPATPARARHGVGPAALRGAGAPAALGHRAFAPLGPGALAGILAAAGVTHLVLPRVYDAVIPPWVPGPARAWTVGSGVAEIAAAGLLAAPRTRRAGGWAAAALFLAVYPANLHMAAAAVARWRARPGDRWSAGVAAATLARLPLQAPLVASSLRVAGPVR